MAMLRGQAALIVASSRRRHRRRPVPRVPRLLRAGHTPLLIPWDKLHITSEQTLLGGYILTLGADADAGEGGEPKRITIRDGIAPEVKARVTGEPTSNTGKDHARRR